MVRILQLRLLNIIKLHGGVSRYEKFKYFHKEFLNEVINQEKVDELAIQFFKYSFR